MKHNMEDRLRMQASVSGSNHLLYQSAMKAGMDTHSDVTVTSYSKDGTKLTIVKPANQATYTVKPNGSTMIARPLISEVSDKGQQVVTSVPGCVIENGRDSESLAELRSSPEGVFESMFDELMGKCCKK